MPNKDFFLAALIIAFFTQASFCQKETLLQPPPPAFQAATPAHMWELGLHGGVAIGWADVDYVPNWGVGFHVRRAIDYVFSVRGDALISQLVFDDNVNGSAETTWQSGSLQLLVSLNNLIWSANSSRKVNAYAIAGGGLNRYKVDVTNSIAKGDINDLDYVVQSTGELGFGLAFRLSDRFNIGFETKGVALFGKHADRLDGVSRQDNDLFSYSSVRLNFNLGNSEKRAEPLYWVNPMESILKDVTELKNRPSFDLTDTDGDGVIDLIDQDNATPEGVEVDTRGLPLDSDGDGIPNHEDDEPYLVKSSRIVTQAPDGTSPVTTEDDVNRIVDERLRQEGGRPSSGGFTSSGVDIEMFNSFLPIIHFGIDSYKIRYADYGSLASIAKLLKSNPEIRIVVTGYTDKTASSAYNEQLSFRRANAAIEHLVNVHGVARSRLLLNYSGENDPLVPASGSSLMNRRTEFRVANASDVDQRKP
jgi:outer membrane protein OmpA-like peptidoglycan-associated protein